MRTYRRIGLDRTTQGQRRTTLLGNQRVLAVQPPFLIFLHTSNLFRKPGKRRERVSIGTQATFIDKDSLLLHPIVSFGVACRCDGLGSGHLSFQDLLARDICVYHADIADDFGFPFSIDLVERSQGRGQFRAATGRGTD